MNYFLFGFGIALGIGVTFLIRQIAARYFDKRSIHEAKSLEAIRGLSDDELLNQANKGLGIERQPETDSEDQSWRSGPV